MDSSSFNTSTCALQDPDFTRIVYRFFRPVGMADENGSAPASEIEDSGEVEPQTVVNGFPIPSPADGAKKPKKSKKPRASVLEYKTVNEM